MNRFLDLFGPGKPKNWNQRVFLPVIHVRPDSEMNKSAIEGAKIAYNAGADGVILINMDGMPGEYRALSNAAVAAREELGPDVNFIIGVNYLGISAASSVCEAALLKIPLVQSDSGSGKQNFETARLNFNWPGVFCGGVAFKYQGEVLQSELPKVIQDASWMDVLTTSGAATGVPIDLEKAYAFLNAPKDCATAVASGVSIDNIDELLPYFNAFFVATSIQGVDFYSIDPEKTEALAKKIHSWRISK